MRTDLAHLLAERGLPADHAAGFSCTLALAKEEAVAPTDGDAATLLLLRHNGQAHAVSMGATRNDRGAGIAGLQTGIGMPLQARFVKENGAMGSA